MTFILQDKRQILIRKSLSLPTLPTKHFFVREIKNKRGKEKIKGMTKEDRE